MDKRRIVFAPGGFGCGACTWTTGRPKRGPFGNTTSRARAAQVRIAFNNHRCELHQKKEA